MKTQATLLFLMAAAISVAANATPTSGAPRCTALLGQKTTDGTITRAEWITAGSALDGAQKGAALTGAAQTATKFPAHCLIEASLNPRNGAGGKPYAIRIQLRLPKNWNKRSLYQGGGGMDGIISPAIGAMPVHGSTATPALARGYAVVSTDSGHQGKNSTDADFGADQQARLDYAYAAIGTVSHATATLIRTYYHRDAKKRYFMGCSNGGREAMMAAQRFANDFDGVLSCNPGFRLSRASIAQAWDVAAFNRAAPKDADGKPILAEALTPADMTLLQQAILDACDDKDGLKDGSIDAMSHCNVGPGHFDPAVLKCPKGKTATCLTEAQIVALKTVFGGAKDSKGNAIYSTWPYDSGIASDAWRAWKLGTSKTGQPNALNATLGVNSMRNYFVTPPAPTLDTTAIDFDTIVEKTAQTAAINDATSTMLSSFQAHGGKLLVIHGNSDPVFSADDLRDYWQKLTRDNGGEDALRQWARLFIVPGMNHCGGGPALDDFDPLSALELWVEKDTAPERILAQGKSFPGRKRPLCAYPQEAHYNGSGDTNSADSFTCRAP